MGAPMEDPKNQAGEDPSGENLPNGLLIIDADFTAYQIKVPFSVH